MGYLVCSGIPTALTNSLLASALGPMQRELGISPKDAKLLNTIPSLPLALAAPLASYFKPKSPRVMGVVLLALLVVTAVIGYLPRLYYWDYWGVFATRIVLGVFCGLIEPLSLCLVNKTPKVFGARATTMSFVSLTFNLAGGAIVQQCGWENIYYFYLMIVALVVPLACGLPALERDGKIALAEVMREKKCGQLTAGLVFPLCSAFFTQLAYFIVPNSISFKLKQIGVDDAFLTGLATGLSMFWNGITSLFLPLLMKLFQSHHIISLLSCCITGVCLWAIGLSSSYILLAIAVSVTGFAMGPQLATCNAWAGAVWERGMGLATFCTFFSHFLTPFIYAQDDECANLLWAGATMVVWALISTLGKELSDSRKANQVQLQLTT